MSQQHYKKLYRSSENKIIAGVCGGLAEYFETDPSIVRIIFLLITLIGGSGIILYLILAIMLPQNDHDNNHEHKEEHSNHSADGHQDNSNMRRGSSHRGMFGMFIVLVGVLLLIDQFFPGLGFDKFWPIFVILFGVLIILR